MSIEVRSLQPDEVGDWIRAQEPPWGERWAQGEVDLMAGVVEPGRALAAVENGRYVGFAAILTSGVGLPGGRLPAAAVTYVGVLPTHRRRGILRSMMRRQLEGLRDGGEPLAILGASESVIYRRFGYGLASFGHRFEIETTHAAFRDPVEPTGRTELVDEHTFLSAAGAIYTRVCAGDDGIPGSIDRTPGYWRYLTGDPKGESPPFGPRQYVLHHGASGVDGYLMYRPRAHWQPNDLAAYELRVEELLAVPGTAEVELWAYVLGHDLVRSVSGYRRPVDDALPHLLRDPRRLVRSPIDDLWVRPLDVVRALEARRYPVAGAMTLTVHDEFCPWVAGTYRLDGGPEGATCTRHAGNPDLELDAAALGSILLGGVTPAELARAGVLGEVVPGAAARATAMFGWHRAPWNLAEF